MAVMGIMAALAVPALKNFGQADAMIAADQQLLTDVARARQLAISQRTTVYMVFVPANFWTQPWAGSTTWTNGLTPDELTAVISLCDKQLTGYTFIADGALGDQPGQHQWHYLAPWQALPDGTFIATNKIIGASYQITDPVSGVSYPIVPFNYTNSIAFPVETNTANLPYLPYIAFNYLGQLTPDGQTVLGRHEYIPLVRGVVAPAMDPATRAFRLSAPQVVENPPGNSTNIYNLIDIDPLTGRATLQEPQLK
jgi:hypothetical protein